MRYGAGLGQHGPPGLGQLGLAGGNPIEQGQAELRLEIVDGVGDRRRRAIEATGGGSKAAGIDHGKQDL